MACPTNYALQLHKKAAATANTCHTTTPCTLSLSAAAAKLELTFLKLNESAVSGKWISNICLKNILQKNEKKITEKKEKDGGKTNCKDKIKICQRLPATPTAP